jgi:hypothetical protein
MQSYQALLDRKLSAGESYASAVVSADFLPYQYQRVAFEATLNSEYLLNTLAQYHLLTAAWLHILADRQGLFTSKLIESVVRAESLHLGWVW